MLTGGGDCPGLNAAIRAIVHAAKRQHGWRLIGVTDGFNGLIWPDQCRELTFESTRGILPLGGTILGTTNSKDPFAFPVGEKGQKTVQDCSWRCIEGMQKLGIEALIVIGGNGTLTIANGISGRRITSAPPATPECNAIQPASRPIISTTITR